MLIKVWYDMKISMVTALDPWIRCAFGNVSFPTGTFILFLHNLHTESVEDMVPL